MCQREHGGGVLKKFRKQMQAESFKASILAIIITIINDKKYFKEPKH